MHHFVNRLAVAMSLVLCGCAFATNRLSPAKVALPVGSEGLVVISAGAPESCTNAVTGLRIAPLGNGYYDSSVDAVEVNNAFIKSDFTDHQGFVSALDVPAGNYELYPVFGNPLSKPIQVPYVKFTVTAGEGIYLGEYFMDRSCSIFRDHGTFRDRAERDLAFVREKNPGLANIVFKTHIAEHFDGYVVGGPDSK